MAIFDITIELLLSKIISIIALYSHHNDVDTGPWQDGGMEEAWLDLAKRLLAEKPAERS